MNGTAKQVASAQDIINEARTTIANNIKNCEEQFAKHPERDEDHQGQPEAVERAHDGCRSQNWS